MYILNCVYTNEIMQAEQVVFMCLEINKYIYTKTNKEAMNLKERKVDVFVGGSEQEGKGKLCKHVIISKQFFRRTGLEIWLSI